MKSNVFSIIGGGILGWFCYQALIYVKQDFVLQAFYGEGQYQRVPVDYHPIGDMVGIKAVPELRAKLQSDSSYTCEHIRVVGGKKPTMTFPDSKEPVCCYLDEKQFLVPVKVVGGNTHLLCGSWPTNEEVIIPGIPKILSH